MSNTTLPQLEQELQDLKDKLVDLARQMKGCDRAQYQKLEYEMDMTEFLITDKEKQIEQKKGEVIMNATRF